MDSFTKILIIVAILILGLGAWWWFGIDRTIEVENNGLSELAPPTEEQAGVPSGWLLSASAAADLYYPEALDSSYVIPVDWPPTLRLEDETFECVEAGAETDRAGGTTLAEVNGRAYCRTVVSKGAAGSVYRQYAYVFPGPEGMAALTFSLRFPECANYEEDQAALCESEQAAFDPDQLTDRIAGTIIWSR